MTDVAFVLSTIAVPIVMYGLMPHLDRLRVRRLTTCAREPERRR